MCSKSFSDATELAPLDLDMILDFAGFGTTTDDAINAVRTGGRVVQVGLGLNEATISTAQLVLKAVTLRGARVGRVQDFEAVIDLMTTDELEILASTTTFEEIPVEIARLQHGDLICRKVSVME